MSAISSVDPSANGGAEENMFCPTRLRVSVDAPKKSCKNTCVGALVMRRARLYRFSIGTTTITCMDQIHGNKITRHDDGLNFMDLFHAGNSFHEK